MRRTSRARRSARRQRSRRMFLESLETRRMLVPDITIADIEVDEDAGTATFTIQLSTTGTDTETVDWDTGNGTATSPADYSAACGTAEFQEGEATVTINISTSNDSLEESDETFYLDLSNAVNANIADSQGVATIRDDDATGMTNDLDIFWFGNDPTHMGYFQTEYTLPGGETLIYNTLGQGTPIIVVETEQPDDSAVPDEIQATLTFDGTDGSTVYYDTTGLTAGDPLRFGLQADATALDTDTYDWELNLAEVHDSDFSYRQFSGTYTIVNTEDSEFGKYWTLAGLDRLHIGNDDIVMQFDDGTTERFSPLDYAGPSWSTNTLEYDPFNDEYTHTDKYGNEAVFNSSGELTKRTDTNGNDTDYTYTSGELTKITRPDGRVTTLTYSSGLLATIVDFDSRTTTFTYSSGELTSITYADPDGGGSQTSPVVDFTYDGTTGLMATFEDPLNNKTTITYDYGDRLQKLTFADSNDIEFVAEISEGFVDLSSEGTSGNPADLFDPADADGTFKNELNDSWKYEYHHLGGPVSMTDPDTTEFTWTRGTYGQPTVYTSPDPDGAGPLGDQVTTYTYDSSVNVTKITLPDSSTQEWEYDSTWNVPKKYTDEEDRITVYSIDSGNGNVTTISKVVGEIDDQFNQETDDLDTVLTYTAAPTQAGDLPGGLIKTVTDPLSIKTTYDYETDDQQSDFAWLTKISLADNETEEQIIEYTYDSAGNVTEVEDGLDRTTTFTFDNLNRRTKITLPDPDGGGAQTSPEIEFAYDAASNRTTMTDALDGVTTYAYDKLNRLEKITYPDPDGGGSQTSPEVEYDYDAAGQLTQFTDALDGVTTYAYDDLGQIDKVTLPDPDGGGSQTSPVWSYGYDLAGNLTTVTDPLSNKTTLTYDSRFRVIKVTYPDPDGGGSQTSPETEYTYNDTSQVTTYTDPLDNVTTYSYHADLAYLTKVTYPDPDGAGGDPSPEIEYSYDDMGNIETFTDELDEVTTITYDDLYRITKITLPDPDDGGSQSSPEIEYMWDDASQLTSITDALDEVATRTYDNVGRLTKVTLPDPDDGGSAASPEYEYEYDAAGNLTEITDPADEEVDYTYDALSRLTKSELPDPDDGGSLGRPTTEFAYDAAGNLTSLTDPEDNETTWTFDALHRVTAETNELSDARSFEYNALGKLTKSTDREGRVIEFTYDNISRLTEEKWKDGATTVNTLSFTYNAAGWLTAADDDNSDYSNMFDNLGRVTQTDIDNGTNNDVRLAATFDTAGNRTELTAAIDSGSGYTDDLKNTYTFDDLQRLTQVKQTNQSGGNSVADKRVDFEYDAAGRFTEITRYDDLTGTNELAVTDFVYDDLGRLTDLTHTHDTTTIADYDWAYNDNSWITQLDFTSSTGNDGVSDYTYDDTGQLEDADHDYQTDESYSYDENGNRTMTGYTTGSNNQLTSDGTFNYTYDDEGNRATRTRTSGTHDDYTTEYAWDHHNRLIEIKYKNNSGTVTKEIDYTYDVFGRRIKKMIDDDGAGAGTAVDTEYVYDGQHILLAFEDDGDLINRYLHGPVVDMILADEEVTTTSSDGDIHWTLGDNLGSVRDIIDSSGTVENHLTYDAYGNITSETDTSVDHIFAYTGRERDEESDLQLHSYQPYDPSVGRTLRHDERSGLLTMGNPTRFANNSPVNGRHGGGEMAVSLGEPLFPPLPNGGNVAQFDHPPLFAGLGAAGGALMLGQPEGHTAAQTQLHHAYNAIEGYETLAGLTPGVGQVLNVVHITTGHDLANRPLSNWQLGWDWFGFVGAPALAAGLGAAGSVLDDIAQHGGCFSEGTMVHLTEEPGDTQALSITILVVAATMFVTLRPWRSLTRNRHYAGNKDGPCNQPDGHQRPVGYDSTQDHRSLTSIWPSVGRLSLALVVLVAFLLSVLSWRVAQVPGGKAHIRPIENIELLDRVIGFNSNETTGNTIDSTANLKSWRIVELRLDDDPSASVTLVRPEGWIRTSGARLGAKISLELPELGVHGQAIVIGVEPCRNASVDLNRLVTGMFRRWVHEVIEIKLSGHESIVCTPGHLIWCEDEQRFIPAATLLPGSTVRTLLEGRTLIESVSRRAAPQMVYNLEVYGEHVYRVGASGLLVHNTSALHTFFHGTDTSSALNFLNGGTLDEALAQANKVGSHPLGFYLADDVGDAAHFAAGHNGTILEYSMTDEALEALKAAGAQLRPIPFFRPRPTWQGNELFLGPEVFGLFNDLLKLGQILVRPAKASGAM